MKARKRKELEQSGWRVGSTEEFLRLSPEEADLVNMRLSLAATVRGRRARLGLTQSEMAHRLGSSQSRFAKLEAGAQGVSLELLVRALLVMGAGPRDVGNAFALARAIVGIRKDSGHYGTDKLAIEDIDTEVSAVRASSRSKRGT